MNDYGIAKDDCGNTIFVFEKKKGKKIQKKKKNRLKLCTKSMFKWRNMFNKIEWKLSL